MALHPTIGAALRGTLLALGLLLWALPGSGNPTKRDNVVGPVAFAKGSTVTVYIEVDPNSKKADGDPEKRDRVADAVAGIEGWVQPLKDLGDVTLKVVKLDGNGKDPATGKAPDYTQSGSVRVTWETSEVIQAAKGSAQAYSEEPAAAGEDDGKGHVTQPEATTGGVIHLNSDATANVAKDKDLAKKNAVHEMGHVLGLDHSDLEAPANVMNPKTELQPDNATPTAEDLKELKHLYASASGPDAFDVEVHAAVAALADGRFAYSYALAYIAGPDFGLFQVGLGVGIELFDVQVPPGWEWLRNGSVVSFDPTFLDDDVPYLDSSRPHLEVSFVAAAAPILQPAWAGRLLQISAPGAVPEPASLGLALAGLLVAISVAGTPRRPRPRRTAVTGRAAGGASTDR